MDRWLTLDPKPQASSRPRGPHGRLEPLRRSVSVRPGGGGSRQPAATPLLPRGLRTRPRLGPWRTPAFLTVPVPFSLPPPPGASPGRPAVPPARGAQSPAYLPLLPMPGPAPLQVSGCGGGGWRARPHPEAPWVHCLCRHRDTRPPHNLRTRVQARPARRWREEARDAPHVGGGRTHRARAPPAPVPRRWAGRALTPGLSSRESLGRGPERQLPGDAQLPGELRPRRPRPERSPLRRVIPRGGPRTTPPPPGSGWDPHPRGDLGKASSSSRRVHASRQLPPPRPARARPAPAPSSKPTPRHSGEEA